MCDCGALDCPVCHPECIDNEMSDEDVERIIDNQAEPEYFDPTAGSCYDTPRGWP